MVVRVRFRPVSAGSPTPLQRILVRLELVEESVAQADPLLLADLALEHGLLDASAVVFAGLRNPAQTASARGFHRGNVIGDEDEHGAI